MKCGGRVEREAQCRARRRRRPTATSALWRARKEEAVAGYGKGAGRWRPRSDGCARGSEEAAGISGADSSRRSHRLWAESVESLIVYSEGIADG